MSLNRNLIATIQLNEEAKNPNNAYFRSINTGKGFKGMYMKKDYKEYKERWKFEALSVMNGIDVYKGKVAIKSIWCFGTKRKKDVQNCGKLEYDSLNGIVYEDDSQIMEINCSKKYEKNNPYVIIEVWAAPDLEELWK